MCRTRSKLEAELEASRQKEAKQHAAESEAARTRERVAAFNAAMQEVRRWSSQWVAQHLTTEEGA